MKTTPFTLKLTNQAPMGVADIRFELKFVNPVDIVSAIQSCMDTSAIFKAIIMTASETYESTKDLRPESVVIQDFNGKTNN